LNFRATLTGPDGNVEEIDHEEDQVFKPILDGFQSPIHNFKIISAKGVPSLRIHLEISKINNPHILKMFRLETG
jgi:hypothetical protein